MSEQVVTLRTFTSVMDAEIAASLLDSEGIPSQVVNDVSTNMIPYITSNAVRLLVNAQDRDRAEHVLDTRG